MTMPAQQTSVYEHRAAIKRLKALAAIVPEGRAAALSDYIEFHEQAIERIENVSNHRTRTNLPGGGTEVRIDPPYDR